MPTLLNRSTRKISLTEVGGAYYERSKQILADRNHADRIAHALHSSPRGTLRLNTSVAIPPFLAPVIAEYADLDPDVSVNRASPNAWWTWWETGSIWRYATRRCPT